MYNEELGARRFYAVNDSEDTPTIIRGSLIPDGKYLFTPRAYIESVGDTITIHRLLTAKPVRIALSLLLIAVASFGSLSFVNNNGQRLLASSIGGGTNVPVIVENPYTHDQTPLNYGVQVAMSQPNFFTETRESFIDAGKTFIEADLTTMQLRFFKDGVLNEQVTILSKGKEGSWWETPAGLYQIKSKEKNHFSTFGHVYQPWSMAFQGNFFIHGWPYYPDGTPVEEGYSGGCVRLSNEDAEKIYNLASVNTPVLVYEQAQTADTFVYEPKIPDLETPHYLIADIESNTVLAGSDLDSEAPIASLVKLMTALVAADYINLDKNVSASHPTFVQSLIPRLQGMNTVSMYSLMQLLLVESSNEAAEVIASQTGREQFIKYMNEKAVALGLDHTTFADPSGLSADNVSTVGDLLRLVQYIYNNRRFIIDLTDNQNLPTAYISGQFGELENFNKIKDLDNFIGGKVGETEAAGQTSISLHKITVKGQNRILAIILLGSKQRNADVNELLSYAQARFAY